MKLVHDINHTEKLVKRIEKVENTAIQIGIFADGEDAEVLVYAGVHEFGAPSINVPERSFIRSTFDSKKTEFEKTIEHYFLQYIDEKINYNTYIKTVGEYLVGVVQETILDMTTPPLKESTIARKGSSELLVDEGRMIDAITWKVD